MSSIVNGYMNAIERENDMFNRSIEIESNKISLMVEAYYNKLENDYLLAEQKVMMENGTYDDLTYLYMEANEESDKNKKGIFAAIKRFIQKIIDRIKSLFGGKESYEGKAPAYYKDLSEDGNKIIGWFNNVLNKIKSSDWGEVALIVAKPVAVSIVGETIKNIGEKASNKLINYTTQEYNKIKEFFKNLFKKTTDTSNAITDACEKSNNENATKLGGIVKDALQQVTTFFTDLWNKFKAHFNKNTDEDGTNEQHTPTEQKSADQSGTNEQPTPTEQNSEPKELTEESKKECNNLGKEMKELGREIYNFVDLLKRHGKEEHGLTETNFKDINDCYNKMKDTTNKQTIQSCYGCLASMISIIGNVKTEENTIKRFKETYDKIEEKYKKFDNKMLGFTFESYYYIMYDYEIVTESFTGDPLVDDLLDILNAF